MRLIYYHNVISSAFWPTYQNRKSIYPNHINPCINQHLLLRWGSIKYNRILLYIIIFNIVKGLLSNYCRNDVQTDIICRCMRFLINLLYYVFVLIILLILNFFFLQVSVRFLNGVFLLMEYQLVMVLNR